MIPNVTRVSPTRLLVALVMLAVLVILSAIATGSSDTGLPDLIELLRGNGDAASQNILLQLRGPRALAAFGVGAMLAVAGVLMQVLLRNPLADPYILGTSGGAAVAALSMMIIGAGPLLVDIAAFAGALGSTLLVFVIARSDGIWTPGRLLLTGVVVAAGWSAAISLILATSPDANLRGILFWLMGDFSFAGNPLPGLIVATGATLICLGFARSLNLLATGDEQAALLGLSVRPARIGVYFLSALLTSVAVTTAGTVGFIGLVIPHLIRLIGGADHRIVVPASALAGGTLLVIADTLARTVVAPQQLPVGAITAVVGVPLFLILLSRR